ncbi:MAG: hypothetical protein V1895_02185 [Parcubacteria group bacterium]
MQSDLATLYLDLDEEITTVIDRIVSAEGNAIILVVPKGAVLTQSIVNLKLLKRAAERAKRQVTIVTRDETGQLLAQRAGFAVRSSVNGPFIALRPVTQSRPSSTIKEDKTLESQTELREDEPVSLRGSIQTEVEAEREIIERPRQAIKTPRRVRILPRVARHEPRVSDGSKRSYGKVGSHVSALLARVRPQKKMSKTSVTSASTRQRVALLPDLPWKRIGAGAGASLVVLFMILTFGFASAEVSITPKKEVATVDFEVTAKEQPDASKHEVLGKLVSLSRDGKKGVNATGRKEIGQKAQGSVTISNSYSDKPQSFGVNTRLQASSGQMFLLTAQVTVPGAKVVKGKKVAGTVSVSVMAEKFGEEYNLGPTALTFVDLPADQQKEITAASDGPMSGGSKKEITVLTNEDVSKARDAIKGELEPTLITEIKTKLAAEEELLEGVSQGSAVKTVTSVPVGQEASQVEVTVTVEVRTIVDRPNDIKAAAREELEKNVPANQELLDEAQEQVNWSKKTIDFEQKKLILTVHAEKASAYRIDTQELLGQLLGKKEDEAASYVQGLAEVSSARVHLTPFWRNSLPNSPKKVQIEVNR